MSRARARTSAQSGLTLIELMVSLVITSIAVAAALGLGFTVMNSYREHSRMVNVERAGRVSLEIIADAVRGSSAGVTTGLLSDEVGCSTYGAFAVTNSTTGPDQLEVIYASGGLLTSLRAAYDGTSDMTVLDGTAFEPGDYVIVTNLDQGHIVQIDPAGTISQGSDDWTFPIAALSCGTLFPGGGYQPGALVVRARVARFFVQDVGGIPTLFMDPDGDGPDTEEPLAEGIEDLQIALGVDVGADGTVADSASETDDWFYNHASDTVPPDFATTVPRALRITLVARSVQETSKQATSIRPAVEDRAAASDPDVFRRRILSTTVEIRNLQGSP